MKQEFPTDEKDRKYFDNEKDPFNPENTLSGVISRAQGGLYGCMHITEINGKPTNQFIYSAPKMHYPFEEYDVETKEYRNFTIPDYDRVEIYKKLDGTAIIAYTYECDGKTFLTYKTRLSPFLHSAKFGDYLGMWRDILDKYPSMHNELQNIPYNAVFELYGLRNRVTIIYDVILDTRLLFFVNKTNGSVITPTKAPATIPALIPKVKLKRFPGLQEYYVKHQQKLENALEINEEEKKIKGDEGTVWYFIKSDNIQQLKCKPDTILKLHWGPESIPKDAIYTTCFNAFESFDDPSVEDVITLLLEEFQMDRIERSRRRIEVALEKAKKDKLLMYEISKIYDKNKLNIQEKKAETMKYLCSRLPDHRPSRVYTMLQRYIQAAQKEI